METESITREQFDAMGGQKRGRDLLPETAKALTLAVDAGTRFKNHEHYSPPSNPKMCRLGHAIRSTAQNHGMQVTYRHDGPDLIVFRLK